VKRRNEGPNSDVFYDSATYGSYLSLLDVSPLVLFCFLFLWIVLLVFVVFLPRLQHMNFAHVHFAFNYVWVFPALLCLCV